MALRVVVVIVAVALCAVAVVTAAAAAAASLDPVGPPPASGCWVVNAPYGIACACTEEYCDTTAPPTIPLAPNEVSWYSSVGSDATQRLTKQPSLQFAFASGAADVDADADADVAFRIAVDSSVTYQRIVGFGGALTDAAALDLSAMTPGVQAQVLNGYYGDAGLQYTLARTHMGSCDFSTREYSYDDHPGDFNLTQFSVSVDDGAGGKVSLIRTALQLTAARTFTRPADGVLKVFATAWSPPAWMKTNGNQTGGSLIGTPGDQYHKTWALYFARFIDEYAARGIPVWAVTPGNEPLGVVWWDSSSMSMATERDFIKLDLGPTLKQTHPEVLIMCGDDQRATVDQFAATVWSDADAAQYVTGVAMHWYSETQDVFSDWDKLDNVASAWLAPSNYQTDRFMLATEACEGYLPIPGLEGPHLGEWSRGLVYAHDILGDLQHGTSGWTDWNVVLDLHGGPNHARNWVDAPVLCDTQNATICYKHGLYYALGHFTRFLPPESRRVGVNSTSTDPLAPPLEVTSFLAPPTNPSVSTQQVVVVVVLNRDPLFGRDFVLTDAARPGQAVRAHIPAASIHTYTYPAP